MEEGLGFGVWIWTGVVPVVCCERETPELEAV